MASFACGNKRLESEKRRKRSNSFTRVERIVWLRFRSGLIMLIALLDAQEEERATRTLRPTYDDDATTEDEDVPTTHAKKPKRDHQKELDELVSALDGLMPPYHRREPSVMQTPPEYPRYPTPPLMREIKERARGLHRLEQPHNSHPMGTQKPLQPSIGTRSMGASIWPDSCDKVAAVVHVPVTIRGVTIKGILWGNIEIDKQTRLEGIVSEMRSVGSETFRLQDMLSCHENTNSGQALAAMIRRVDTAIAKRMPDSFQFKIGITWNPPHRWSHPKYGYLHDGYVHMEILAWDFRAAMIGCFEAALINHYQRDKPLLCLNKKLGDDNRQDMSPQFLYVACLP